MISVLILAAGQSRRMRGRDKLLEDIDGTPLLHLQAQRAIAVQHPVYVAVPSLDHPRMAQIQGLDVTPITVPDAADGIGVSIRTAIAAIPPCDAILLCLADLVAIETADLQAVIQAKTQYPDALVWRGATEDGKPGHPILIDASLRPAFLTLSGDQGGAAILKGHIDQTHLVALPGHRALLDLDTPEDWAAWRKTRQK